MTRQEFENWVLSKGYAKDKFGHYQKTLNNGITTRFKIQANSIRFEHKVKIVDHNEWIKSQSGYYKNLSITPEGKLRGMGR